MSISFTFAGTEKLVDPSISIEKLQVLLPGVEIKMEIILIEDSIPETHGSDTIKTYRLGKPPEFTSEREEKEWFDNLIELAIRLEGSGIPFWYPEGPVVLSGVGGDGYFHVGFKLDMPFTEVMMAEITKAINKEAKEIKFNGEVPIIFGRTGPTVDDDRTLVYRPIIGGIYIQNRDQGHTGYSTLGWSAVRSGVNGYVVSGHIGYNRPLPNGSTIYQPTYPNYPAGVVRAVPTSPYYADVAWVEYSNVAPKIYLTPDLIVSVNFYQEPSVDSTVYMSGYGSGLKNGVVKYVYVSAPSIEFGTLYRQALATYDRGKGDSGAPVYIPTLYGRGIVGIHSGANWHNGQYLARFSPTSGVNTEVGAVPLTTWP